MLNRLIVLIDFSETTDSLVSLANNWAQLLKAEVLLLHQVPGTAPVLTNQSVKDEIIENEIMEAKHKLKDLADSRFSKEILIYTQVTGKNLVETLTHLTGRSHHNLILIGLKGTGLMKKFFFGSMATKIIEEVNQTTVNIPPHAFELQPDELSIAIHPKFPLNTKALDLTLTMFANCIKKIEFITLIKSEDEEQESRAYLDKINQDYSSKIKTSTHVFTGDDLANDLKAYMENKSCSILVLQKGSRNLSDSLLRRFLVKDLVHDGSMPLIIMP
jgi:nucleotide-binding universal stress UspA family protein